MRLSPSVPTFAAALALLVLPPALSAQTPGSAPGAQRPAGCRGTTSQTSSISAVPPGGSEPVVIPSYPTIESIQPGSPAERAGLRYGDVVILMDGHDMVANPPTQPRFAGDTVQLVVQRNGVEVPIRIVLGRWDPPQEAPGVERTCKPVDAAAGD